MIAIPIQDSGSVLFIHLVFETGLHVLIEFKKLEFFIYDLPVYNIRSSF